MFNNIYPSVQKIASVKGVVHKNGRTIAGIIARETSFSALQIWGWLELIARLPCRVVCWFVCFCCNVVIHLWIVGLWVPVTSMLDLTDDGVECCIDCVAADASPTNLVSDIGLGWPLTPWDTCPKHRAALLRINIWDSILKLSNFSNFCNKIVNMLRMMLIWGFPNIIFFSFWSASNWMNIAVY